MRKWLGAVCVLLGLALLSGACFLYRQNAAEDQAAGAAAEAVTTALLARLPAEAPRETVEVPLEQTEPEEIEAEAPGMPAVELDGNLYIGVVSIPALELELPVMDQWDYEKLKLSPCRHFGSSRTNDLVIAAHNYKTHFGRLGNLVPGDRVAFTELDGAVNGYTVEKLETLSPDMVDRVRDSGYPLVLYTCTYGGQTRTVVYCSRIEKMTPEA